MTDDPAKDEPLRCIHEVLNEAVSLTRAESPEDIPRLDVVASAIRSTADDLHIDVNDPQVLEGVAAGIHLVALRAAAYMTWGVLSEGQYDAVMHVSGELIQTLGLMYVAPPTPSLSTLEAMMPAQRTAVDG